jgi:DNA-binding SARP family transcriptional activator
MASVSLNIVGACRIDVGDKQLHPTSPQLFAAALYLSIESGRATSRDELQQLLFSPSAGRAARSHNLRQLLYRLGSLGFPITCSRDLVRMDSLQVEHPLAQLRAQSPADRVALPSVALEVLPGYVPGISRPYEEWLDRARIRLQREVRRVLQSDLDRHQRLGEWEHVIVAARTLLAFEPHNTTALKSLVEASLVRNDLSGAITAIDDFLAELEPIDSADFSEVLELRRRLGRRARGCAPPPLVGRGDTLAALFEAWRLAEASQPQYLVVTGPAGIGKTRIASAICELAASRGVKAIEYTCGDNDRHRPLALFARTVATLLALPGGLGISPSAFSLLNRLSRADDLLSTAASDPISSEILRSDLKDALIDLFDAVSTESRLLLVVDDAHRLDAASWAVLSAIAMRVKVGSAMVVLCSRSTTPIQRQLRLARWRVLPLGRLTQEESRALFHSVAPGVAHQAPAVAEAIRLAAGNPFFIQAIARHALVSSTATVSSDVTVLAASSYHALDDSARLVLEVVLILGDMATPRRVGDVSALDDLTFLRALRLLEEDGLLTSVAQNLRCSHDLLADALRSLIPHSVAAVIRQRIAERLEAECSADGFDASLAWAAADAWLTLGNAMAATRMLRRCAAHAASLGEHSEAAQMLSRLLSHPLPAADEWAVLDEAIRYAEVGGDRSLRARALREKLTLHELGEPTVGRLSQQQLVALRIAVAEADLNEAGSLDSIIAESRAALIDTTLDSQLRLRAGASLLMAADLALDAPLGASCWHTMQPLLRLDSVDRTQALRAELIYHTVFGSPRKGIVAARQLLRMHGVDSMGVTPVTARRNALFALQVLGESTTFSRSALATYKSLKEAKVHTEALFIATSIAERAIDRGDLPLALDWLNRGSELLARQHQTAQGVVQGYLSLVAFAALFVGDFSAATELLAAVRKCLRLAATPRLEAVGAAHRIRVAVMQKVAIPSSICLTSLRQLYEAGSTLGRQDSIVEGLWLAYDASGDSGEATRLLDEYLAKRRREIGPPEWSLRYSTRSDPVWQRHEAATSLVASSFEVLEPQFRSLAQRVLQLCN